MPPVSLPEVAATRAALETHGFMLARQLLAADEAARLLYSARNLAVRRVTCGIPNVAWGEQSVPPGTELYTLFHSDPVRSWVSASAAFAAAEPVECWTSRYAEGEYINEHCDVRGYVQLLLCLRARPGQAGGALVLGAGGASRQICLEAGDGVLLYAARLPHATTPLVPTDACRAPSRVVAVGRYFQEIV